MSSLASLLNVSSEQHVELGVSRKRRDNINLQKIISWFNGHNPFSITEPCLKSLSTGLIATEGINCDDAEAVNKNIQKSFDNLTVEEAKISKKDQVKTLDTLQTGMMIDSRTVYIKPLILFTRVAAIIQRDGCVTDHFKYELNPEPASLFKGGYMRKPSKSSLRNYILKKADGNITLSSVSCVTDGGALLHKVKWKIETIFEDVIKSYQDYIQTRFYRYHNLCIVFDGYDDKLSVKAIEHKRRSLQSASQNVNITKNMILTTNRETFLRNNVNKDQFIKLLCQKLQQSGTNTLQSKGDADVLIIKKKLKKLPRKMWMKLQRT